MSHDYRVDMQHLAAPSLRPERSQVARLLASPRFCTSLYQSDLFLFPWADGKRHRCRIRIPAKGETIARGDSGGSYCKSSRGPAFARVLFIPGLGCTPLTGLHFNQCTCCVRKLLRRAYCPQFIRVLARRTRYLVTSTLADLFVLSDTEIHHDTIAYSLQFSSHLIWDNQETRYLFSPSRTYVQGFPYIYNRSYRMFFLLN